MNKGSQGRGLLLAARRKDCACERTPRCACCPFGVLAWCVPLALPCPALQGVGNFNYRLKFEVELDVARLKWLSAPGVAVDWSLGGRERGGEGRPGGRGSPVSAGASRTALCQNTLHIDSKGSGLRDSKLKMERRAAKREASALRPSDLPQLSLRLSSSSEEVCIAQNDLDHAGIL